ncbi:MAG: MoaD family protein [Candidatus Heimdallarchaeota archaeon]|nr:MoaD family protein [Candidatus Heimdallarchaeota archaeon]
MRVILRSFAMIREILNAKEIEIEITDNASINVLITVLLNSYPDLQNYVSLVESTGILVIVNDKKMDFPDWENEKLKDGDVVVLVPPAGGG